jgi:N-dimethylarginine dimethylaminohydrolase
VRRRFATVVEVHERDAVVLGLNAVSDGPHRRAGGRRDRLRRPAPALGFSPAGVDMSELRKAGGA